MFYVEPLILFIICAVVSYLYQSDLCFLAVRLAVIELVPIKITPRLEITDNLYMAVFSVGIMLLVQGLLR